MTKTIKILILEDDLETLSKLLGDLAKLENKYSSEGLSISTIVLSEYKQVEELINKSTLEFDVVLLDRDCKIGGSFHVLDIEKFGADKIISISSMPQWNNDAQERGVTKVVHKDYQELELFSEHVIDIVEEIINANKNSWGRQVAEDMVKNLNRNVNDGSDPL